MINECVTKKSSLLCFVVAGGGFPGRTFGALNHFVRGVLPSYSHAAESMLRVVRVHAGTVILPNQARSSAPMHKTIGGTRRRHPCKHEPAFGFDVWGALRRA